MNLGEAILNAAMVVSAVAAVVALVGVFSTRRRYDREQQTRENNHRREQERREMLRDRRGHR